MNHMRLPKLVSNESDMAYYNFILGFKIHRQKGKKEPPQAHYQASIVDSTTCPLEF